MATEVSILGRVRGALRDIYGTMAGVAPVLSDGAELITVLGMPELTEIVRQGNSWQVALATGLAAGTALPTTTAGLSLWNGEAGGGKSYVIDSFGSWEGVADATQPDNTLIFAMQNVVPVAAPTATALTKQGLSGKVYGGKARSVSGLSVTNDGWFPHLCLAQSSLTGAGSLQWKVNEVAARGLYVVQPGGCFNIAAVKASAAAAAQQFFYIRWHEIQLSLG